MRYLIAVPLLALLLSGGCISVVTNEMIWHERDFQDSNPGNTDEALAAVPAEDVEAVFKHLPPMEEMGKMTPKDRAEAIDKAVETARDADELSAPSSDALETGRVTNPISGQSGRGYIINVFSQAGTTTQDVSAQVDAAVRARLAAQSPNADLSGNVEEPGTPVEPKKPEEPKPDA